MMMTIEAIKTRLAELEQQRKQLQANLFAIDGALQDCEYWLAQFQEPPANEIASHLRSRQEGDES
jgi:prefoldin subunit 5